MSSTQDLASICVRLSTEKMCDRQCAFCAYNVGTSTYAQQALATARFNYVNQKIVHRDAMCTLRSAKLGRYIVVGLIMFVAWLLFAQPLHGQSIQNPIYQLEQSGLNVRITQMPASFALHRIISTPNKPRNIPAILTLIENAGVRDINYDGFVNCIDFSITFRNLYGENATLIINYNWETRMNHMFVRIWDGVSIIDVEPQGTPSNYSMGSVWGMQYDPAYNEDVTSAWGGYSGF